MTKLQNLSVKLKSLLLWQQGLGLCFFNKNIQRCMSNTSDIDSAFEPVIEFPLKFKRKMILKRTPKKKISERSALNLAKPGKILISSDNRSHNMYTNEFCSKFNPPNLTSASWTSYKSPGRHFTIHPIRENPSIKVEDSTPFDKLGLSPEILDVLRITNMNHPTVIQSKAIPEILNGKNVMLAAETGSGKTLAYLLPIFHHLMALKDGKSRAQSSSSPLALILTPTRELVFQVLRSLTGLEAVCVTSPRRGVVECCLDLIVKLSVEKYLRLDCQNMARSLDLPVSCESLASTSKVKYVNNSNEGIADILIATPVALATALRKGKLDASLLKFAVVDECDTLLDDSFSKVLVFILKHFNIKHGISLPLLGNQSAQLILSSATYPKYANTVLENIISFDNVVAVRSGYLHRVSTHVKHRFLRVRPSEKFSEFIKLLEASKDARTIVFCNFHKTAKWLHSACTENAIASLLIDGDLEPKIRSKRLKDFLDGDYRILITTDLLSRGLDTKRVELVINYEVPDSVSDYLHRCGRVGRVGQHQSCSVTTLVSKRWEISIINQIEEAARRREEISDVSANIKSLHSARWRLKNKNEEEVLL